MIVGLSGRDGGITNPKGLNVDEEIKHRKTTGSIFGFKDAKDLPSQAVLNLECDILIPAALENPIHADNARKIKAKIIPEDANGPISLKGEEILMEDGPLILPDIFLNAGCVTVSYFEWLKNLQYVSFGRMTKKYEEIANRSMVDAFEKLTCHTLPSDYRNILAKGPAEIDFVKSSLEETMDRAYHDKREAWTTQKLPNVGGASRRRLLFLKKFRFNKGEQPGSQKGK